jgi:hypothetical protein
LVVVSASSSSGPIPSGGGVLDDRLDFGGIDWLDDV